MSELQKRFVVAGQGCVFVPGQVSRIPLCPGPNATFATDEQVQATTTLTNSESRDQGEARLP
jgi:hypothetical protein